MSAIVDYADIMKKTFPSDGKAAPAPGRQRKPKNSNPRKGGREKGNKKRHGRKASAAQTEKKNGTANGKPAAPVKSIKALEASIKNNPSGGGATYASRKDRGEKPGVARYIVARLRKGTRDKGVDKTKLYEAMVKEFGPGTKWDKRAEGLWITLNDYIYRNLKNRLKIITGQSKDGGLYIKSEPK